MIIWILSINNVFALSVKTFTAWWESYNVSYISEPDITQIEIINNNLADLDSIFNNEVYSKTYKIEWNNLWNYKLVLNTNYFKVDWMSIVDIFNRYWINLDTYLNLNFFTTADSKNYIKNYINKLFWNLNIQENSSVINQIIDNYTNKLYLYKVNKDINQINGTVLIDNQTKDYLLNLLKIGIENSINDLNENYSTDLKIFSDINSYISNLDGSITNTADLNTKYSESVNLLNTNYINVKANIEKQFTSSEITNLNTLKGTNSDINNIFTDVLNLTKCWFPYIYNTSTRTSFLNDINTLKSNFLNKINARRQYLDNIINGNTNTDSITYTNWLYNNSGSLLINGSLEVNDNVSPLDQIFEAYVWVIQSENDLINSSSKEILSFITNQAINIKKTNIDDIWYSIISNIEQIEANNSINSSLLIPWLRLKNILVNEVKQTYLGLNLTETIKNITPLLINIDSDIISVLLDKYAKNFLTQSLNNPNIVNKILPFSLEVKNESIFRNSLKNTNSLLFQDFDKALQTSVPSVNSNEEWIDLITFWYSPTPKIIKNVSDQKIWINIWDLDIYYLDSTFNNFQIDLTKWYNYRIKTSSFNSSINDVNFTYKAYNWENSPILINGSKSLSNDNWIISSIENIKEVNSSKNTLFVNDIIKK